MTARDDDSCARDDCAFASVPSGWAALCAVLPTLNLARPIAAAVAVRQARAALRRMEQCAACGVVRARAPAAAPRERATA